MKLVNVNITETPAYFTTYKISVPDDISNDKLDKILRKIRKKNSINEINELFEKHNIKILNTEIPSHPSSVISFELNDYEFINSVTIPTIELCEDKEQEYLI